MNTKEGMMDMKVQKSRKYIAKKLGVLAMAAVITGGSFCQPVFAAKTITSAKTENAVQKHNKVAADPTQGELPDKDGKPSGVKWALDTATGELSITGSGVPYLGSVMDNPAASPFWKSHREEIKKVVIEKTVRPVSMEGWFSRCSVLESVSKLPDSVVNAHRLFGDCIRLKKTPDFPENLEVASCMYDGCKNLTTVSDLPDHLKDAMDMFSGCEKLVDIPKLPQRLESGYRMFAGAGIENVLESDLPSGLKDGSYMFQGCKKIEKVYGLPDSLEKGYYMFYGCSNLDYVKKLPKGLKDAQGMFGACYNLKKFTKEFQIPDKAVTTVMFWAREGELHPTWVPAANKSLVNYPNWGSEGRGIILYCTVSLRDSERKLLKEVDVRYGDEFKKEQLPQAPKGYHWILPDLSELNQVEKDLTVTLQKEKEEYTVKFQDWNGKLLNEQKVGFEEAAKEPKAPARTGYTFTGWDKSFDKITGDNVVKAEYKKNEYTVKFQDWDGKLLNEQKVEFEEAAKEPKAPARTGYTFTGWDKSFDKITGDNVVKAEYKKNEYTVKFQDWDGKLLNEQKVEFEEAAKEPKAPARAGYTFTGWDKSFNKITGEITVTAKYSRNPAKADSTPHYNAQSKKPGVESLNRKLPLTKAVKSGRQIKVRWKKKKGAKGYVIYYSTKKKGKYKKIAVVGNRSNTKVILKSGKKYYFKARPYTKMKNGKIKYKKYIKAKKKELNKVVQVTYKNVSGYGKYEIW
ncbi:InlB B-repeat-containing protein, partial [Anaerostipes caccae]